MHRDWILLCSSCRNVKFSLLIDWSLIMANDYYIPDYGDDRELIEMAEYDQWLDECARKQIDEYLDELAKGE